MPESDYTIISETFESLSSYWHTYRSDFRWDCLFVLPPWLKVWGQEFGSPRDLYLRAVRHRDTVVGIAPLQVKGESAFFLGSTDLCDCLDFVVRPGSERGFFEVLLDDLVQRGIRRLSLGPLRPDSTTLGHLLGIARDRSFEVLCKQEDVSLEMDLPPTWEEYLAILQGKQRHEVRRKLRRLRETGDINYQTFESIETMGDAIELFLRLFRESRVDKELFLTSERETFFRSLAEAMAQENLLRIGVLELDGEPVAAVMCFDYNDTIYLYNNGYDSQYGSLSIGLISKILCIKESIERGRRKFDFLKGAEQYKYRLGGEEVHLQRCQITLRQAQ